MEVVRFLHLPIQGGAASAKKEGGWMYAIDTAALSVGLVTWGISNLPSCRK